MALSNEEALLLVFRAELDEDVPSSALRLEPNTNEEEA